jgi:hypothetical protein
MDADVHAKLVPVPLYDLFLQGSAAGVSEAVNVVRYLIWQVGPFQIDIRVESTNQSDRYKVAGLVAHVRDNSEPQPNITVSLFSHGNELARTKTDHLGGFSMEHRQPGKLQVRLAFSDEIYVPVEIGEGVYSDRRSAT